MKTIEYFVVSEKTLTALIKMVNSMLDEGWSIQGPMVSANGDYMQTMVRRDSL